MTSTRHYVATPPATGLNLSQPQITAPVLEYRCMFTHDLRKKAKKWHDGSLRFHTFNKRVMVYDETKNLVGGLHYRSSEDFDEGLELNLDTHVLVQVEERLGESSTDLTSLLSKQKQDESSQPSRLNPPIRSTLSKINAANTNVKPKSIKELLAGSQQSTARQGLLSKSPYERNHVLVEPQPREPEPKRRKVIHLDDEEQVDDPGRTSVTVQVPLEVNTASKSQAVEVGFSSRAKPAPPPPPPPQKRSTLSSKSALNTTTTTTTSSSVAKSALNGLDVTESRTSKHKKKRSIQVDLGLQASSLDSRSPVARSRPLPRQPVDNVTSQGRRNSQVTPQASSNRPRNSSVKHPAGPRSSLKFAARKSRPKLMYRALLLESPGVNSNSPKSQTVHASKRDEQSSRSRQETSSLRRQRKTHFIEADKLFSGSQECAQPTNNHHISFQGSDMPETTGCDDLEIPEHLSTKHNADNSPQTNIRTGIEALNKVPDSPLFLPRSTSQISASPSPNLVRSDFQPFLLSQQASGHASDRCSLNTMLSESQVPGRTSSPLDVSNEVSVIPSSPAFYQLGDQSNEPGNPPTVDFQSAYTLKHTEDTTSLSSDQARVPDLVGSMFSTKIRTSRRVVSEDIRHEHDRFEDAHSMSSEESRGSTGNSAPMRLQRNSKSPVQSNTSLDPVNFHQVVPDPTITNPWSEVTAEPDQPSIEHEPVELDVLEDDTISRRPPEPLPPAETEESGPWTSTEAFLLFDWWPAGRQKPAFQMHHLPLATIANSGPSSTSHMSKKKYGTFGSARFVSQR